MSTQRRQGWASAVVLVGAGVLCSACGGSPTVEVEFVAGGGDDPQAPTAESVRLDGTVSDLAAHDGMVHALVYDGECTLVTVDADGSVDRQSVDEGVEWLATGPNGRVYVAGSDGVSEVRDGQVTSLVSTADAASPSGDVVVLPEGLGVGGVAVDGEGRLIVSATFIGSGPDEGSEPVMTKIFGVDETGSLVHIAGADSAEVEGDEMQELAASPPADVQAVDFPLDGFAREGEIAAGEDGSVYLGGTSSVLRIAPDGKIEAVVTDGERALPDEPYADADDASGFGGSWVGSNIAVDGETLAVVDNAVELEQERVDVESIAWGDELGESAQELADRIVRGLKADESIDSAGGTAPYGGAAVLVHDGQAATAMAHATNVALEGDRLYVAGETAESGPESESLIVSTPVPEDWRSQH